MTYPTDWDAASFLNDWDIDYDNKTFTQAAGSTGNAWAVNHFYIGAMDVFDELLQLDDDSPLDYDTPTRILLINGWDFDAPTTDIQFFKGGSIIRDSDNRTWANVYSIGTLLGDDDNLMVLQNGSLITQFWAAGHIDILVEVHNGTDWIDSGNLIVFSRESGQEYDHFAVTATESRNVVSVNTANDLNDDGTGHLVTGVSLSYTNANKDIGDGGGSQPYSTIVDCGGNTLADVYKYLKDIVERGKTGTVDGVQGQIYRSAAGLGAVEVKKAPFGTFAGGKLFGAPGIYFESMAAGDANNYEVIDNNGVTRSPPSYNTIAVTKIEEGDRVSVARTVTEGGAIQVPYTLNGAHSIGGGTVTVNETPTADEPTTNGYIRVDGIPYEYSARSGSVFTLVGTLNENHNTGVGVYCPLIEKEAGVGVTELSQSFQWDDNFYYRAVVRQGSGANAIKPWEQTGQATDSVTLIAQRIPNKVINP